MMRTRFACCLLAIGLVALQAFAIAQTPDNGPAAKRLVSVIDALRSGTSEYHDMEAPMAKELALQATIFPPILKRMGPLQSVELLRTQQGERVYDVWFANGRMTWGVTESASGKIAGMRTEVRQYR